MDLRHRWNRGRKSYASGSIVVSALLLLTAGCADRKEATVEGSVTLDGKPLTHGSIFFEPVGSGKMAGGVIDARGRYSVQTNQTLGLVPGEYLVAVSVLEPGIEPPGGGLPMPGKLLIPEKYATAATSGFRYTIAPGKNVINLELVSSSQAETLKSVVFDGDPVKI